jgi:hypothetical protein
MDRGKIVASRLDFALRDTPAKKYRRSKKRGGGDMLTEFQIWRAKPGDKSYELTDGKGLALRVHPTGTKIWIYRYRHAGKARRLTLGVFMATAMVA